MRIIEQTEKYVLDNEAQAVALINAAKETAEKEGYVLGASGYTYKTKKSKEGPWEAWVVTIKKVLGGVWDDFE